MCRAEIGCDMCRAEIGRDVCSATKWVKRLDLMRGARERRPRRVSQQSKGAPTAPALCCTERTRAISLEVSTRRFVPWL